MGKIHDLTNMAAPITSHVTLNVIMNQLKKDVAALKSRGLGELALHLHHNLQCNLQTSIQGK